MLQLSILAATSSGVDLTLAVAIGAGLISFLSPCVLPLVPPYLGYLGGTTFEQLSDEKGLERMPDTGLFKQNKAWCEAQKKK